MKNRSLSIKAFSFLTLIGIGSSAHAAISITADPTTPMMIASGGAVWDTVTFPPSNNANVYWDANADGIFGNSAGENTGNTAGTIPFTISTIVGGSSFNFGLEGFPVAGATGSTSFTITNTDASTQLLNVVQGTPTAFSDSNGDQWTADFRFNNSGYGDVVFNGGTGGNGAFTPDHQGVLSFSRVPEPSSILFGLSALALLARRRR